MSSSVGTCRMSPKDAVGRIKFDPSVNGSTGGPDPLESLFS